jgi:hypothetical protein
LPRQVYLLLNTPAFAGHTTVRAVFPRAAFMNGLSRSEEKDSVRQDQLERPHLVHQRVDLLLLTFEHQIIWQSPGSVTFGFFTKGTFHLHAPFSSASIYPRSIHSRTSFPGPLSVRRCRSRELFVSRFRYYYVLRLLQQHHFPLRFSLIGSLTRLCAGTDAGLLGSRMNLPYRAASKHLGAMGE